MRILITYGSLTGNTMLVSEDLQTYLCTKSGLTVDLIDQGTLSPADMCKYDLVLCGGSTWGEGDPNPSTDAFVASLKADTTDLQGVKVALFGLGDRSYEHFCGIVDHLESLFRAKGCTIVGESLRLDGFPEDPMYEMIHTWADTAIASLSPTT